VVNRLTLDLSAPTRRRRDRDRCRHRRRRRRLTAGYLSGHLDGLDLAGRLRRGVTLGAFAVGSRGDWEGLPRRHELSLLDGQETGSTIR
jgi:hypothetical protein